MSGEALLLEYHITRRELARGFADAPSFRRQITILGCLSVPTLLILGNAPGTKWWMLPPIVALLALQVYRVPSRRARRSLGKRAEALGSLWVTTLGIEAKGLVSAKAPWRSLRAFGESRHSFQIEMADGPVLIVPKRELAEDQCERLRSLARGAVPELPRWPVWAMLAVSAGLAAAILLSLEYGPQNAP